MEEIDEFLGINNGIENMQVDEQVNGANNRAGILHGMRNDQQNQIVGPRNEVNIQPAELAAGAGIQPNNLLPIEPQVGGDELGGFNQDNIEGQRNAGNQGNAAAGNQANNRIPIDQQRGNAGAAGLNQAIIGGQRNAGNQGLRIPVQGNDIPAGNHIQVEQRAVRQGNRPVQGQNGQQPAGVLQDVNVNQRTNGRAVNRNRGHRSAPYNQNAGRIRTRNYNNLAQLLMSMAKQGAYVPANHDQQDENYEEAE